MQQSNALTARLLNTLEAAELLGLSPRTLEKHRTYGTGPLYRKLGCRVVYDGVDLKAWADKGRRASTSDFGTDTVYSAKRRTEKVASGINENPWFSSVLNHDAAPLP